MESLSATPGFAKANGNGVKTIAGLENRAGLSADAVFDQLSCDLKVRNLLDSFECATGIKLKLARWALPSADEMKEHVRCLPFCNRFINSSEAALQHCIQVHTKLRVATEMGPAQVSCAPGLLHAGVAIFVHGEAIGFLLVSGIAEDSHADRRSYAALREILASNGNSGKVAHLPVLLRLLDKLERHPSNRIDGIKQLLEAVAHYIANHAVNFVPKREAILPATLFRAMEYGKKHHAYEALTLVGVAQEVGVSPRRLAQLFRGTMREPFSAWLARYRISKAMEQLRTDRKRIMDIAFECGFGTISSFNRAFQKFTGITPGEYRDGCEPGPNPLPTK